MSPNQQTIHKNQEITQGWKGQRQVAKRVGRSTLYRETEAQLVHMEDCQRIPEEKPKE